MPRHSNTRFYMRHPNGHFSRLFWIRSHRPNEMMLGAYSLDGSIATITHEFPEIRHSPGDSPTSTVKWEDAAPVELEVDHFTCHADGRFHLKARTGQELYSHHESAPSPLGPRAPVFLDVSITSDLAQRYATIRGEPKPPHVWFEIPSRTVVSLSALFSGIQFPLMAEALGWMSASGHDQAAVVLRSGVFQGVVWGRPIPVSTEAEDSRPPGTLFMFHWRRGSTSVGLKAFIFA
jgi:hypothetical protein